jgi:hypothetical protein
MATQKKQILLPDPAKRKKMSGKFDTDDFEPVILSTLALNPQLAKVDENFLREHECAPGEYDKNWFEVLTCKKRIVRIPSHDKAPPLPELYPPQGITPEVGVTSEKMLFPVAILLARPVHVLYGLGGSFGEENRKWIVNDLKTKGISRRHAQAALGAAWKGFGEAAINWPAIESASFKFAVSHRTLGVNTDTPREVTMLRDVALWIHWDIWERNKLTLVKRTEILNSWGYKCTPKAVKRVVEKVLG